MKRMLALLLGLALLAGICGGAWAESGEPSAEWTVMIYLCGTDLETVHQSATANLTEISKTVPVDSVNLVIETGGTEEWHTQEALGLDIANDRLQRWTYGKDGFTLTDEQKDARMSAADTLSDFIRWSTENYPAKKYMLLLWDHGGGSNSGLLVDENYGDAIMPVYTLERALREGGTHFDLILTDTCLMASLEMCQAVAPYADWLAASEEVMAGDGTSYEKWVQYLYDRPDCSARQIGKQICDLTQQAYIEREDKYTIAMFTMSLIDLKKIGPVAEAYEAFMREAAGLTRDPQAFYAYAQATYYTDNYMKTEMCDLYDLTRRAEKGGISAGAAHAVQDAIEEAVVYNLRSANHSFSHGLSVWYKLNAESTELDHFARTCKNPEQLAFFDAISLKWDAPDWVYEKAERHPELGRTDYLITTAAAFSDDRTKAYMMLESGEMASVTVSYELMYNDAASGIPITLGESGDISEENDEAAGKTRFVMNFNGTWPTLEGVPLSLTMTDDTENYAIYDVTVLINNESEREKLRVIYNYPAEASEDGEKEAQPAGYMISGVWDGLDAHTGLPGRNVYSLNEYKGRPMMLYQSVYNEKLKTIANYLPAKEITIREDMQIEEKPLPEGEYTFRYVVHDVFGNKTYSDIFPVIWDGQMVSFPNPKAE